MEGKRIEIDGNTYDLEDPIQRKAAVRAWLEAQARRRSGDGDKEVKEKEPQCEKGPS